MVKNIVDTFVCRGKSNLAYKFIFSDFISFISGVASNQEYGSLEAE
jgi:hypothetical protein